jgi:hypothetical protein
MRKLVPMALVILVATLTMSGIGQAQGVTTVQGTIQAVDCQTHALVVNARDGSHVFPAGPQTTVYVNSSPASLCALQQYVGRNAIVSLAPYANQWVVERVDVNFDAAPGPAQSPPSPALVSGMPKWAGVALAAVLIGGVLFIAVNGHQKAVQSEPYHQCSDGSWGQWCPYP